MSECDGGDGGGVQLEQTLAKRNAEILRLREEVQRLQLTLQEAQQSTANHIARLQQQLANKMDNIEKLKAKLDSQQDYEKIKEELRILKERKLASEHLHPLSEDVLSQKPLDDARSVSSVTGVEIKREVESPSMPHSSRELLEQFGKLEHISWRTTPSPSPPACPPFSSSSSPQDPPAYLCIKSDYRTEGSGAGEVEENVWSGSVWADNTLDGNTVDVEKQMETLEITQKVKELLQKHKIGQRVFGHYVLGRMQGSVSEILAHPKPWSKLTTRGKEPFLRMIHFLSDEQNVLVLRIIQDRLRGSGSIVINTTDSGSDDVIRNILKQAKHELQSEKQGGETRIQQRQSRYDTTRDKTPVRESEDFIRGILEQTRHEIQTQQDTKHQNEQSVMTSELQVKQEEGENQRLDQLPSDNDLLNMVSPTDFVQNIIQKVKSEIEKNTSSDLLPTINQDPSLISQEYNSPLLRANYNLYLNRTQDKMLSPNSRNERQFVEIKMIPENVNAVLTPLESFKENWQPQPQAGQSLSSPLSDLHTGLNTQKLMVSSLELDTLSITRRVKEVLAENSLGQRLFGENVLGLTQGSVSDLLARPKPWSELSIKGREPFLRMHFWLSDPEGVENLKEMKRTGQRGCIKRPFTFLSSGSDSSSQEALLDITADHPDHFHFHFTKRPRVVLSSEEKEILSRTFQTEPYPSNHTIQILSSQLCLQPSTVTNWFYNHRSRLRRVAQAESLVASDASHSPLLDPELVSQLHCSDSDSYSSAACTDTRLLTVKEEPGVIEISEERLEDTQYVSTGVQSCRNLKLEKGGDWRRLSPELDVNGFGNLRKEDPDGLK